MENRLDRGFQSIAATSVAGRGGSRPQPPKAVARSASLEAPRPVTDTQKAKRSLTPKTVAGPRWGLRPQTPNFFASSPTPAPSQQPASRLVQRTPAAQR